MNISPYIAFDGNGAEALQYYCDTLGATMVSTMSFGDMPMEADWITDANRNRLAHGAIQLGDQKIFASDTPGFEPHEGFKGVTLQVAFDDLEEAQTFFDKLAADGEVRMPFAPTFWAKGFGMLHDRFGVAWMVNVDGPPDA